MIRMSELAPLPASEAWRPFRPGIDGDWNVAQAAHLYRRGGFGAPLEQLQQAVDQSPDQAVSGLIEAVEPDTYRSTMATLAHAAAASGDTRSLAAWWLRRIISSPAQAQERLVLFWHGHFATSAEKVTDVSLMLQQNELFRTHAMSAFEPFVQAVSQDPAMLLWLDAAASRKAHPNENYARELMELFCLGEGNYTEQDIREAARCFTGWEVRRKQFRFNRFQHDSGSKTVLGVTGAFGGEDVVQVVLQQSAAAEFLICKLVRYYLRDDIADVVNLCQPLIRQYRDNGLVLKPILKQILNSRLFHSPWCVGYRVRSPIDLAAGLLRCFAGSANTVQLSDQTKEAGQGLFFPPGVQGWDEGRAWINTSTLLGRSNLIAEMLTDSATRFSGQSPADYVRDKFSDDAETIVQQIQDLLFSRPIPGSTAAQAVELLHHRTDQSIREALQLLCSIPEFQLC